jgi:hypothetical protein
LDGINQSPPAFQTVVVGAGIEAGQSFLVDDRGSVRTSVNGPGAAVLNAGAGLTRIGNDALSGGIISVGHVDVLDRARVGSITSASTITVSPSAIVGGPVVPLASVALPALPGLPTFPPAGPNITLNSGQSLAPGPGSFGTVNLNSGSTLTLAAGDYFFRSLTINSAVTVRVSAATRVFVLNTMALRSSFTLPGGQLQAITLGFGGATLTLEAPFNGTLIAPNASVAFGAGSGIAFSGSFFGRTLEVRPLSTLICQ